jgi:hypothetical protein
LRGSQIEREIVVELGGDGRKNAVPINLKGHGCRIWIFVESGIPSCALPPAHT